MTNYRRRLVIVVLGATIWSLGVVLMVFDRGVRETLARENNAIALIAVCFCAASIFAFYFIAKRMPRFAVALAVLSAYMVLLSIYAVASLVLKVDNVWTDVMHYLILAILPLTTFILSWQGRKRLKEDKEKIEKN